MALIPRARLVAEPGSAAVVRAALPPCARVPAVLGLS